jgi:hypothetical protein
LYPVATLRPLSKSSMISTETQKWAQFQQYKIGLNIRLAGLNKSLSDEKLRAHQHSLANQDFPRR